MKATGRLRRWLGDSLFKRLFLLMWASLVLSHVAAFGVVVARNGGWSFGAPLPTFPSLPPTPGLPGAGVAPGRGLHPHPHLPQAGPLEREGLDLPAAFGGDDDVYWAGPAFGPGDAPMRHFGGLPPADLALDYGVRLLVIALAAWWGARWVAAPMRRLAGAAQQLGPALREGTAPPALDEHAGTLEVREAAQVFNAMAQQLQQQFRARTLLMASVSHDVRTPLTRLRLRLERLERPEDAPLVRRCIADLREIDALVESALELTRSEQAQEAPRSTDLAALVQAVADDRIEQGQALSCDCAGDGAEAGGAPATARVQPAALRRVLDNLLDNALRHGTRARLGLRREAGAVCITVDDDGPGIPEAQLDAVLDPFVQLGDADPRRHHRAGLGLGLHIARDLVRRQGGTLTLANLSGGGLRAQVRLPAAA
jgi:signal transduction histidine kinase